MTVATSSINSRLARPSLAIANRGVWSRYLGTAAIAAMADLLTKEIAARMLADGHTVSLADRLSLMLVYNTGTAGGFSIGPFTWTLNVLVTVAALAMVLRIVQPLSAIDARATIALGLLSGGAFGNLSSILLGPSGVADFLAVHFGNDTTVVMNVADLMLWSGALLLVPVVLKMIGMVRLERVSR